MNQKKYTGPKARSVGHKKYDLLLKDIMLAVQRNKSREEILELVLNGISEISLADSFVILELDKFLDEKNNEVELIKGYDQRKIQKDRWTRFCEKHNAEIPKDSLIYDVIKFEKEIDVWGSYYIEESVKVFKFLFDIEKGGWLIGIHLARATAKHNSRGIFIWYSTGKNLDKVPQGAEQDLRFLKFVQYCYDMAGFSLKKAARSIIMQRQELLRTLAPSIMNHEIHSRVDQFNEGLISLKCDIENYLNNPKKNISIKVKNLISKLKFDLDNTLIPHAEKLKSISHSVMGLSRRVKTDLINPVDEINSAIELLSYLAKKGGIIINPIEFAGDIKIKSDPALIMHIMVNLINNSIYELAKVKDIDPLKIYEICIRVFRYEPNEKNFYLGIDVQDNGNGIDLEDTKMIFEAGITKKQGGHGLGLYISKIVAEYLGGSLILFKRKDPTIFRLVLPKEHEQLTDLEEELKSEIETL